MQKPSAVIAAVLALCATPALAACVTFDDFVRGVQITQADGSIWTARRGAHEVMRLDQTNATGVYAVYVIGTYGVFPTETSRNTIGGTTEYTYAKSAPQPTLAMDWTSDYRVNSIPAFDKSRQDWHPGKAHVTTGDLRDVTIGGCPYRVMAVDMALTAQDSSFVLHYAYFPDLRFGTQTRITYANGKKVEAGVTAMAVLK